MTKRSGRKPGLLPLEVAAEMAWAKRRRRRQTHVSDQRLARMLETALRGAGLNAMPPLTPQAALKPTPKLPSNVERAARRARRPKKDSRSSIGDLLALKLDVQ